MSLHKRIMCSVVLVVSLFLVSACDECPACGWCGDGHPVRKSVNAKWTGAEVFVIAWRWAFNSWELARTDRVVCGAEG